jgi:hypothetical protein
VCLLVAVLKSVRQWHFLFPQKKFLPFVNCCFLHVIIPVNLHQHRSDFVLTLWKFNEQFNVSLLP